MIQIEKAIIALLREGGAGTGVGTLATQVGHTDEDIRITMYHPDMDVKMPSVIVDGDTTHNIVAGRTVYSTQYRVEAYALERVAASNLIETVRAILSDASTSSRRSHGPDFSTSDIRAHSLELVSIGKLEWNQDLKHWSGELTLRAVWSLK